MVFYSACSTHNPKVVGSNPTPATNQINELQALQEAQFLDCAVNVP
jgi:hypothetical protein